MAAAAPLRRLSTARDGRETAEAGLAPAGNVTVMTTSASNRRPVAAGDMTKSIANLSEHQQSWLNSAWGSVLSIIA